MFLSDKFLKLTGGCHEGQTRDHDNIYIIIPHNERSINLQIAEILNRRVKWKWAYHQGISQNNGSYLSSLNNSFRRRSDKTQIGHGVGSIDHKGPVCIEPQTYNILKRQNVGKGFDSSNIKRTTVAKMKIRTDGIASGRFSFPVALCFRTIVLTDLTKSVTAIPVITNVTIIQPHKIWAHQRKM